MVNIISFWKMVGGTWSTSKEMYFLSSSIYFTYFDTLNTKVFALDGKQYGWSFLYWALGPNFQKKETFLDRRHLYYKTCANAKCCTKNGNTSSFDNHDETFIFPRDVLKI